MKYNTRKYIDSIEKKTGNQNLENLKAIGSSYISD